MVASSLHETDEPVEWPRKRDRSTPVPVCSMACETAHVIRVLCFTALQTPP